MKHLIAHINELFELLSPLGNYCQCGAKVAGRECKYCGRER